MRIPREGADGHRRACTVWKRAKAHSFSYSRRITWDYASSPAVPVPEKQNIYTGRSSSCPRRNRRAGFLW